MEVLTKQKSIELLPTKSKQGSIEHYQHYQQEYDRLNSLLSITPIFLRSALAHNIDAVLIALKEYKSNM